MSSQSGFTGIWCPACDRAQTPTRLIRQMAAKQEGMLLKCPTCSRTFSYAALMASNPKPRMDKVEFVEKQPPGTQILPLWIYPEVIAALQQKFPSNLMTTLCSAITALADPDAVLIEGDYAREMASIGVKRGREVLALAKEVKELREAVAAARLREQTLQQFFGSIGMAMPQPLAQQPAQQPASQSVSQPASPSADPTALPVDEQGNPLVPPHAQFSSLREDGSGMLVPSDGSDPMASPASQFSFPTGAVPAADARPGFITRNLR